MAAETKYSNLFTSAGVPVNGRIARGIGGTGSEIGFITDLDLGEAGDFQAFVPVPVGAQLHRFELDIPDTDTHATPTSDADVVLRTWDSTGAVVDTVLLNAGTLFQAAAKTFYHLNKVVVPESQKGYGIVGLKVVTAAATLGTGLNSLRVEWT